MRRTALLLAAALVLPACSGDDKSSSVRESPSAAVPLPTDTPKPVIAAGPKPTTLVSKDLIVGTGRTAVPGDAITVKYVGVHYDGKEFDSTFGPDDNPLTFTLGGEEVIRGWDQGLIGMKVGGRRQLVIPPELGYGAEGKGTIGPNETLVFVVDLISVDRGIAPNNTFAPQ